MLGACILRLLVPVEIKSYAIQNPSDLYSSGQPFYTMHFVWYATCSTTLLYSTESMYNQHNGVGQSYLYLVQVPYAVFSTSKDTDIPK